MRGKKLLLFLMSLLVFSCNNDDFDVGYIGIKQVQHMHADGKIKLMVDVASEAVKLNVDAEDQKISQNVASGVAQTIVIEGMEEGDHVLTLTTEDAHGRISDPLIHYIHVYGEEYCKTLKVRTPVGMDYQDGKIIFKFNAASADHKYSLCSYIKTGDQPTVDTLKADAIELSLRDVDFTKGYEFHSYYAPTDRTYEFFDGGSEQMEWGKVKVQHAKDMVTEVHLQTDDAGDAWGGSIAKLFDGIVDGGNFYHAGTESVLPLTFTVDLGKEVELLQMDIDARPGFGHRLSKRYDIYGHVDLINAETETSCADLDAWETEMFSKGWKKIGYIDVALAQTGNAKTVIKFDDGVDGARYIRIRCDKNWENSQYLNLGEITFYVNAIYNN
ncbi:hypothetical protein EYV94_00730 [Puteibacter caeruleilacunae]|nr:hypothetical protein EYV94_00730 [Puteibacter caeruleilacunae]